MHHRSKIQILLLRSASLGGVMIRTTHPFLTSEGWSEVGVRIGNESRLIRLGVRSISKVTTTPTPMLSAVLSWAIIVAFALVMYARMQDRPLSPPVQSIGAPAVVFGSDLPVAPVHSRGGAAGGLT